MGRCASFRRTWVQLRLTPVEVDIVDAESQRYGPWSWSAEEDKESASKRREGRGTVRFVVIRYGGTGVWKEAKSDCVELTVRLVARGRAASHVSEDFIYY